MTDAATITERRKIRSADVNAADLGSATEAITQMYDDQLDVLIVRGALAAAPLAAVGNQLDRDDRDPGWARPNERMPPVTGTRPNL